MKLVVIYGPPAVGKLTTAERLGDVTGYGVLHSHLAIDLVSAVTPDESAKKYSNLLFKIIYDTIEFAWRDKQKGIIMTMAYTGSKKHKEFLKRLKTLVESDGGKIFFVRLSCSMKELKRRVVNPSRDYYGKLINPVELERWMAKENYLSRINFAQLMVINNTNVEADVVAKRIKAHFHL